MGESDYEELIANVLARGIMLVNGHTFCINESLTDSSCSMLCRMKNSDYIKGNKNIKAISPKFVYDEPFGYGPFFICP